MLAMQQQIAVQQVAFSEAELPLALGVSRRAAARIARELGVRIGGRRIVERGKLLDWLSRQPSASDKRTTAAPTVSPPHEFRIR